MARIVIKDLPESVDLDRRAMLAIAGGARLGGQRNILPGTLFRNARIIAHPGGALADSARRDAKARK